MENMARLSSYYDQFKEVLPEDCESHSLILTSTPNKMVNNLVLKMYVSAMTLLSPLSLQASLVSVVRPACLSC